MTNKEIISYECEKLESIRQKLIRLGSTAKENYFKTQIRELGEIIYELTKKINDNGPTNQRKN